ncbi:unnamed protein product, partial [Pleuronectes platessa]
TFVFVLHLHSLQLLHFSPPLPHNTLQLVLHVTQLVKPGSSVLPPPEPSWI